MSKFLDSLNSHNRLYQYHYRRHVKALNSGNYSRHSDIKSKYHWDCLQFQKNKGKMLTASEKKLIFSYYSKSGTYKERRDYCALRKKYGYIPR